MSNPQRIILIVVAVVVAMMLLYPPFQFVVSNGAAIGAGYSWILSPPRRGGNGPPATVDVAMLLVQWLGALTIAGLAYLIAGDRSRSRNLPDLARAALPASTQKAKEGVRAPSRNRSKSGDRQTTDNESFWLHLGLIAVVVLLLLVAYAGVVTYASGVGAHAGAKFFLTKLASSALSWAIGLSPAIVIRRVYGAPLTKGAAFGVAALVWGALSYLLFLSTAGDSETRLMYGWTGVGIMAALNLHILLWVPRRSNQSAADSIGMPREPDSNVLQSVAVADAEAEARQSVPHQPIRNSGTPRIVWVFVVVAVFALFLIVADDEERQSTASSSSITPADAGRSANRAPVPDRSVSPTSDANPLEKEPDFVRWAGNDFHWAVVERIDQQLRADPRWAGTSIEDRIPELAHRTKYALREVAQAGTNAPSSRWRQFCDSDYFNSLSPAEQENARERFYQSEVVPRIPAGQEAAYRLEWDRRSLSIVATTQVARSMGAR